MCTASRFEVDYEGQEKGKEGDRHHDQCFNYNAPGGQLQVSALFFPWLGIRRKSGEKEEDMEEEEQKKEKISFSTSTCTSSSLVVARVVFAVAIERAHQRLVQTASEIATPSARTCALSV